MSSSEKQPVLFIEFAEGGRCRVTDQARKFLSDVHDELAVVSVAGQARTGKSTLLNRVVLRPPTEDPPEVPFEVGSTVNSCTRGIWLSPELLCPPPGSRAHRVLVLDSEGVGSVEADRTHDVRVTALVLLLSSTFVYNSPGAITSSVLQEMSLVTNLLPRLLTGQHRATGLGEVGEEDHPPDERPPTSDQTQIPGLVWVLRDFTLDLADASGRARSAGEYFEDCLRIQNRTQELSCFRSRKLVTLPRPAEGSLHGLQTLPSTRMDPLFVKQATSLHRDLLATAEPKTFCGFPVTGQMLLALADQLTSAVNQGAVPVVKDAWDLVSTVQTQSLARRLLSQLQLSLQKGQVLRVEGRLLDPPTWAEVRGELVRGARATFRAGAMAAPLPEVESAFLSDVAALIASEDGAFTDALSHELEAARAGIRAAVLPEDGPFTTEPARALLEPRRKFLETFIQGDWAPTAFSGMVEPILTQVADKLAGAHEAAQVAARLALADAEQLRTRLYDQAKEKEAETEELHLVQTKCGKLELELQEIRAVVIPQTAREARREADRVAATERDRADRASRELEEAKEAVGLARVEVEEVLRSAAAEKERSFAQNRQLVEENTRLLEQQSLNEQRITEIKASAERLREELETQRRVTGDEQTRCGELVQKLTGVKRQRAEQHQQALEFHMGLQEALADRDGLREEVARLAEREEASANRCALLQTQLEQAGRTLQRLREEKKRQDSGQKRSIASGLVSGVWQSLGTGGGQM